MKSDKPIKKPIKKLYEAEMKDLKLNTSTHGIGNRVAVQLTDGVVPRGFTPNKEYVFDMQKKPGKKKY